MHSKTWPTHEQGERKRQQMLEILRDNPNLTIPEIAAAVGLSTHQVRRHRKTLIANGQWPTLLSSPQKVAKVS